MRATNYIKVFHQCPMCSSTEIAIWWIEDYAVCYDCDGPDQELVQ